MMSLRESSVQYEIQNIEKKKRPKLWKESTELRE